MVNIYRDDVDRNKHYIATYYLAVDHINTDYSLADAAFNLAVGQSIGNPTKRAEMETDEMFENHSCLILANEEDLKGEVRGEVKIAFPEANIDFATDGISQLLVQTMGGQMDIDIVHKCHLLDIEFTPTMEACLQGPKIGLKEVKEYCGIPDDQVILGGITKPKIGLSPEQHLELTKRLVDGGCNFIKEDEILSGAAHCNMEKRVELVANYLRDTNSKVFYCASIHSDPAHLLERVKTVYNCGGNGVHVNFHCGLGAYKSIRELDLPMLIHYQKSGDKILNEVSHKYHIAPELMFKLVSKSGCGTLHAGMIGGYLSDDEEYMKGIIKMLNDQNSIPALSCGMHPGLVEYIKSVVGHCNWMANVGGAITAHPMGTEAGARAMKQAVTGEYGKEFGVAVNKWGVKQP